MTITAISVENLRKITKSGRLELRPLTLLVGANSVGKSSLVRLFPLLKQSFLEQPKGPILWGGRWVDFGAFKTAVRRQGIGEGITLAFGVYLTYDKIARTLPRTSFIYSRGFQERAKSPQGLALDASVRLGANRNDDTGYVRTVRIELGSNSIEIDFRQYDSLTEIRIDGEKFQLSSSGYRVIRNKLFPSYSATVTISLQDGARITLEREEKYFEQAASLVRRICRTGLSNESSENIVRRLPVDSKSRFEAALAQNFQESGGLTEQVAKRRAAGALANELWRVVVMMWLPSLLSAIDNEIRGLAINSHWIAPLRATAERYYRLQDLAIETIDPSGANLAIFINSLQRRGHAPNDRREHDRRTAASGSVVAYRISVKLPAR